MTEFKKHERKIKTIEEYKLGNMPEKFGDKKDESLFVPIIHSYARYLLMRKGIKIFQGEEQILPSIINENNPHLITKGITFPNFFDCGPVNPILKTGTIIASGETIEITKYEDLLNLGWCIQKRKVIGGFFSFSYGNRRNIYSMKRGFGKKQFEYYVTRLENKNENYLQDIPRNHKIIIDNKNKLIKLIGPNVNNDVWTKMSAGPKEEEDTDFLGRPLLINLEENKTKNIKINELPVGFCLQTNELVCIPKGTDPRTMLITGARGVGKTIWLHALCDLIYWHWNVPCVVFNDFNAETDTWTIPSNEEKFKIILKKINLYPRPLPCYYLYPYLKDHNKPNIVEPINGHISIEWKSFIKRFHDYTHGNKEFDMKSSKKYVNLNTLSEFKTTEQVLEYANTSSTSKEGKAMLYFIFNHFFNKELVDISNGISPNIKIEKYSSGIKISEMNAPLILGLMDCGIVPIFRPYDLNYVTSGKDNFKPIYINYLINSIYDEKQNNKYFKEKEIYEFVDELEEVIRSGASDAIVTAVQLGRTRNVGFVGSTQNYTKIVPEIRNNRDYLFFMHINSNTEMNQVCKDFNAPDYVRKDLPNLGKKYKFECYIFPSKDLVCYNLSDGTRRVTQDIMKIITLPPLSKNYKPSQSVNN